MTIAFMFYDDQGETIIHFDAVLEVIRRENKLTIVTHRHSHEIVMTSTEEAKSMVQNYLDYFTDLDPEVPEDLDDLLDTKGT